MLPSHSLKQSKLFQNRDDSCQLCLVLPAILWLSAYVAAEVVAAGVVAATPSFWRGWTPMEISEAKTPGLECCKVAVVVQIQCE
jgi:hypothetical protein